MNERDGGIDPEVRIFILNSVMPIYVAAVYTRVFRGGSEVGGAKLAQGLRQKQTETILSTRRFLRRDGSLGGTSFPAVVPGKADDVE